jgi:hypothetical protein
MEHLLGLRSEPGDPRAKRPQALGQSKRSPVRWLIRRRRPLLSVRHEAFITGPPNTSYLEDSEALLGYVMRTVALRDLVPAGPEDPGRLTRHSEEQDALFGPFEQSRRSRPRFPQLPERRAEGEAEEM